METSRGKLSIDQFAIASPRQLTNDPSPLEQLEIGAGLAREQHDALVQGAAQSLLPVRSHLQTASGCVVVDSIHEKYKYK